MKWRRENLGPSWKEPIDLYYCPAGGSPHVSCQQYKIAFRAGFYPKIKISPGRKVKIFF
jgi:hypothetical protein